MTTRAIFVHSSESAHFFEMSHLYPTHEGNLNIKYNILLIKREHVKESPRRFKLDTEYHVYPSSKGKDDDFTRLHIVETK